MHHTMEGYAKLASLMGAYPDVGILRRFGALNAQNLLYMQAELVALEDEFRNISDNDCKSDDANRQNHARDWYTLSASENDTNNGETGSQWKVALILREKLKEYSRSARFEPSRPLMNGVKMKHSSFRANLQDCVLPTLAISHFFGSG